MSKSISVGDKVNITKYFTSLLGVNCHTDILGEVTRIVTNYDYLVKVNSAPSTWDYLIDTTLLLNENYFTVVEPSFGTPAIGLIFQWPHGTDMTEHLRAIEMAQDQFGIDIEQFPGEPFKYSVTGPLEDIMRFFRFLSIYDL